MTNSDVKVRRSQLVSTYGVGGLVPSASSSFMIAGLHEWNEDRCIVVDEPRLTRSLGVYELKAPPAGRDHDVPVVRFPLTQICSKCRRIGTNTELGGEWNASRCECHQESKLAPFRLVCICWRGHIDEFPCFQWLHAGQAVDSDADHDMSMLSLGRTSSMGDLKLQCTCGVEDKSLAGVTEAYALKGLMSCRGHRPWLGFAHSESCSEIPQVVQRGASNVWFPAVRSAISIPPYSEELAKYVGKQWVMLSAGVTEAQLSKLAIASRGRFTSKQILAEIDRRRKDEEGAPPDEKTLRKQEFDALMAGRSESEGKSSDFVCERTVVDGDFEERRPEVITELRKVSRLREVRALYGFTRLDGLANDENLCPMAPEDPSWMPAMEVIGEGIFVGLDAHRLRDWSRSSFAQRRARLLKTGADQHAAAFKRKRKAVDIVEVALHTLAHVLIDQLSLDAGYAASALRERLFVGDDMAGVLVYTAANDSAGTLGGLAAQAEPNRFAAVIREGLTRLSWCSSDPTCMESVASGTDALNLAACHCCVLAPETSCELNNTYLDRGVLFGTGAAGEDDRGLFSDFLSAD